MNICLMGGKQVEKLKNINNLATYINWLDSITHNDEAPGSSPGVATTLARFN